MATAPIYCTHKELKRVFPQIDEFDVKSPIYGWAVSSGSLYVAHDCGLVNQLFADGSDLGAAEANSGAVTSNGEWFYDSTNDVVYYYNSATNPNDLLMESGEEFTTMVTQFRTDASRYLDSKLDPNLPKNQFKDKSGNFDYLIIRTAALLCAVFMIRATDPTSEMASAMMEEAGGNIDDLNNGKAALSHQNTSDSSKGIIRDVSYTDGSVRPVDTRGHYSGTFDLIRITIGTGGAMDGTATYSVWVKDGDKLGNQQGNQVVTNEKINGDYQALAGGLQIRFSGETKASVATATNEWEVEVQGWTEEVDSNTLKSIRQTRRF